MAWTSCLVQSYRIWGCGLSSATTALAWLFLLKGRLVLMSLNEECLDLHTITGGEFEPFPRVNLGEESVAKGLTKHRRTVINCRFCTLCRAAKIEGGAAVRMACSGP